MTISELSANDVGSTRDCIVPNCTGEATGFHVRCSEHLRASGCTTPDCQGVDEGKGGWAKGKCRSCNAVIAERRGATQRVNNREARDPSRVGVAAREEASGELGDASPRALARKIPPLVDRIVKVAPVYSGSRDELRELRADLRDVLAALVEATNSLTR